MNDSMLFRNERFEAEILDPRANFERVRLPLEIRWDPLTGQSSRLLPQGSLSPPVRLDLERLASESRAECPFCPERLEQSTPRFAPEFWPDGRIRRGEAVLFPNLLSYAKWSSVSVYSPQRHLVPIEKLDAVLIADNLRTQATFVRAVGESDPSSAWFSINANQLPPSGSSIFHPHLQGAANPVPTTVQRLLAEVAPERFREYVRLERGSGERYLGSTGRVEWLASFAPIGPVEVRAFAFDVASPYELEHGLADEIASGLSHALGLYSEIGFQSFNLAIYGAPPGTRGYPLTLRLVARSYFGPLRRSDAMWSERLHWEGATDLAPERVAELGRIHFSS